IAPIGRPDMPDQPLRIFRTPRLVLEIGKNIPAFGQVRDDPPAPHGEPLRLVGFAPESEVDERSRRGKAGLGLTVCVVDGRPHPYSCLEERAVTTGRLDDA